MKFEEDVQLAPLTTLGIGGPARLYVTVHTAQEMEEALQQAWVESLPVFILGKGSNCLFSDQGFDGLVILNKIDFLRDHGEGRFEVGGGYSFSLLGIKTARSGWSGLEFASGIPGSVGGAVTMNAGANGQETCDVLTEVEAVTKEGIRRFGRKELDYSYRSSPFQNSSMAVVGATFQLEPSETARKHQIDILGRRKETQPLKSKSAGCMFRNPPGHSAGALIEEAGLKGFGVGDAKVSETHANFLINEGAASASEMEALIAEVQKRVKEQTGIELEQEVKRVSS